MKNKNYRLFNNKRRGSRPRNSISVNLSGWHLVAAIGIIGVIISFQFVVKRGETENLLKIKILERIREDRPANEMGFVLRKRDESDGIKKQSKKGQA